MRRTSVVLCSYSFGLGNGIAHVDTAVAAGLDPERFAVRHFVLRPDFPAGKVARLAGAEHLALADAHAVLFELLCSADLLHVNGPFDPVACNAAAMAGVPAVVEVMHQVEPGGLHRGTDLVVCVSDLAAAAQTHPKTLVIANGIDLERFAFQAGQRQPERITILEAANSAKVLHQELSDLAPLLDDARLRFLGAGNRAPGPHLENMGLVEDMPALYHESDLLFLIERRAAFGLVFAEAMACGTLPIVSGDSGATALVRHGETGWVATAPRSRAETLATLRLALKTLGTPRHLAMQRAARELVEQKFSQRRMLRDYERLYAELGARPRKEPSRPEAWMHLAIFAQLFRDKNPEAGKSLEAFLAESRPLEKHFLNHPTGRAVLHSLLSDACPALLKAGCARLARGLCARLRRAGCASPQLEAIERAARARLGAR